MTLTQLRYFVHVVSLRSFARAAEQLHVAQSAVSRQVRQLEDELEVALLTRGPRGAEPTEAGTALLERARHLLDFAEATRAQVRARTAAPGGPLRIGFNPSLSRMFAAGAIGELRRRLPQVTVAATDALTESLQAALLAGRIDAAVTTAPAPHAELAVQLLFWEHLWLIASPGAPLPQRGRAGAPGVADLQELPLIQTSGTHHIRQLLDAAAARAGVRLRVVVEADTLSVIRDLVAGGIGYHVSPYTAFRQELESGGLAGVPLGKLRISRALVRHAQRPEGRALAEFTRILEAQVRREIPARQLLLQAQRAARLRKD